MEYMMVMGFAFLMLIPTIIIFFQQEPKIVDQASIAQLRKAGSELEKSIYTVYYLGAPTKEELTLYLPENLKGGTIKNNQIILTIDSYSLGRYNYTIETNINITGTINPHPGLNKFIIEAKEYEVEIRT